MTFKSTGKISIIKVEALELDIDKSSFAVLENIDEILHIIEGEFLYCGLVIEAQLIVNEKQLEDFISFQASLKVHKILNSKLFVSSNENFDISTYKFKQNAQFVSTENIDTEDEYEVFKLI